MKILGISALYHDSAAAYIEDGIVIAAAQEERFTRKKQDASFPTNAIQYCLKESGRKLSELDAVVFYDKPLLKFERLLETYYTNAPKGIRSFLSFAPVWIKEKLFLKKIIKDELLLIDKEWSSKKVPLLFPEHHLSHAASAFFPSPYDEAAILTVDGVGEWATATIMHGKDNNIKMLKELHFPHSLGLLYSAFTYYLGFRVNSGEYKLMGMAPYGDPSSEELERYKKLILDKMVDLKEDGSIFLDQKYFNYATGLKMVHESAWEELLGFPKRGAESEIEQHHCNLALAIQQITEESVLRLAKTAKELTGADYLTLAGGVALNCVANGKLLRSGLFKEIWIQPAAGDAGGALGAALAVHHIYFNKPRKADNIHDMMRGSLLGPEFSDHDTELMLRQYRAKAVKIDDFDALCEMVAGYLSDGKVVGWHQGKMEWGPRALGNRSILGDARNKEMQKKLNLKIKYRESFRPFAPSVLFEEMPKFFEIEKPSPYMLLVADVQKKRRHTLPENYHQLPLKERLYTERSDIPAITHLDFSARVQSVHKFTNPRYWHLIDTFRQKTGYGLVVNTSFNVRGEPIVCTPEDSYRCFMRTEMDFLVIGDYFFIKEEQPDWDNKDNWKEEFVLD
ncbi:carbamoyltransferase [bacterium]|nr:carbamoyltransferase [bacterium]